MKLTKNIFALSLVAMAITGCEEIDQNSDETLVIDPYVVVDTSQRDSFDNEKTIDEPLYGEQFYGQDAQTTTTLPDYVDNSDGTVTDANTGLMWAKTPDLNGDGVINIDDKFSFDELVIKAQESDLAGYDDWRLPTIKELYSLMNFNGTDPSSGGGLECPPEGELPPEGDMPPEGGTPPEGELPPECSGEGTEPLPVLEPIENIPFIDTNYFDFAYGDVDAGEREIDAQYATTSLYVANTANDGGRTLFGVNFADGRIKGYGLTLFGQDKVFAVMYVRGGTEDGEEYGINYFTDNEDETITDQATNLMWSKNDSLAAMSWSEAMAWVQVKNEEGYLGYGDWTLPDAKQLQSIVDYSRSPDTTDSPAINAIFNSTQIVNEAGQDDFAAYWTSTTHINTSKTPGSAAVYINFGRAMGFMNDNWVDVHGAGAQRSDPKVGNPEDFPEGFGPQGDAIRIYNFVRMVRQAD